MILSKRYAVFVVASTFTALTLAKSASENSKAQTAAVAPTGCLECLEEQAIRNIRNLYHLRLIPASVVSADPDPAKWKDPRTKVALSDPLEIQKLAIGMINVTLASDEPQPDISGAGRPPRKSPNGVYHSEGSGVAVGECIIATNHHVAFAGYDEASVKKDTAIEIEFIRTTKGPNGSLAPQLVKSSGVVIADLGYKGPTDETHKDIVFIRIDQTIPKDEIMPPCFATTSESGLIPVGSASYFKDESQPDGSTLWEQKKCKIFGGVDNPKDAKLWATNCPIVPGVSGSPIYAKFPKTKKLCALGIMQGARTNNIQISQNREKVEYNKMVPFSQVISKERLKKIIDSVDCGKPIDPIKPPKRIVI